MTRDALLLACLAMVGCGDTRGPSDGSILVTMDAGGPATDSGRVAVDGGPDAGPGASPDAGLDAGPPPGPEFALCRLGCATSADCTTPSPAFDADNYRCESGSCRYTGCVDDAECAATFASADYACHDLGTGSRACLERCTTSADCGSAPGAFDADNYRCESGACRYQGCNTDAECETTFGSAYGCLAVEPPPIPIPVPVAARNCVRRCATASDCATDTGAFDADNFECAGGACRYQGCNADAECQTSLRNSAYVCR